MKIQDLLKKEFIIPSLTARDKAGVLAELIGRVVSLQPGVDAPAILKVILDRENLGSTGIGEGVAIPHGKMKDLESFYILFGRSRDGIDFQSMDNKPTHLFFLLLAPEDSAAVHLKVLARIARLLMDGDFKRGLMEAQTAEEIYTLIVNEDNKYS